MANRVALRSDTSVYRNWTYVPKWKLWEHKADDGIRTYSLMLLDEKKPTRSIRFISRVINAKLRYMYDYQQDYLMELLNSGKLYLYLLRLDRNVKNAIDKQVELWQETDKDYLAAKGDFLREYEISQQLRMEAEHMIFNTMVYVQ